MDPRIRGLNFISGVVAFGPKWDRGLRRNSQAAVITLSIFSQFPSPTFERASPSIKNGVILCAASGVHRCGNPEGMTGKGSPSNAPIAATRVKTKRTAEKRSIGGLAPHL